MLGGKYNRIAQSETVKKTIKYIPEKLAIFWFTGKKKRSFPERYSDELFNHNAPTAKGTGASFR